MANQLALRVHLQPLQSILVDHRSHIFLYETGGVSAHSQATMIPLYPENGSLFTSADVYAKNIISPGDVHQVPTRVLCLENTLSGMIYPIEEIRLGTFFHWLVYLLSS